MKARVLLIDDHQIIRDGLRLLLRDQTDFELVGNAFDSESGWDAVNELKPDMVVMDLNVPGEGGVGLTERIRKQLPEIKVVVLTGHTEPQYVNAALAAGANGYLLKGNGFTVLLQALRSVLAGQTYLCPEASTIVVKQLQRGGAGSRSLLSTREVEVLRELADGATTKEIAFNLGVSVKTVETHRMHVMEKLGLRSIAELTKYAVREGLTNL